MKSIVCLLKMCHLFHTGEDNLPKPVKKQKPINGTHRLIEITLLITGIAAVNFSKKSVTE
jgi:hypothetical protein